MSEQYKQKQVLFGSVANFLNKTAAEGWEFAAFVGKQYEWCDSVYIEVLLKRAANTSGAEPK